MAQRVKPLAYHGCMISAVVILLLPIFWMLTTSLKHEEDVLKLPPEWLPYHPTLEHFFKLFNQASDFPVARWFFNSIFVSGATTALVLLISSMAAFALARLKFAGRDRVALTIISTMFVPAPVLLVPVFLVIVRLHLFDTYAALILPALSGAFGVFLLRQFMLQIPLELEECAYLEGASTWTVYSRVIIPLSRPALATLAIFTFIGSWNDFGWPLIATNSLAYRTLPVGLSIFQGRYTNEYGLSMASAAVATIPMIIVFAIFQKHITQGIALTGMK